jgi:hypothetical protein
MTRNKFSQSWRNNKIKEIKKREKDYHISKSSQIKANSSPKEIESNQNSGIDTVKNAKVFSL